MSDFDTEPAQRSADAGGTDAFARDATGLVREVSLFRAMMFGASSGPLGLVIISILPFATIFSAPHPWPIWVAVLLATVLCIPNLLNYAALTAAMPRSGGDYVFSSRILRPDLGFAGSFCLAISQIAGAGAFLALLVPTLISPLLSIIGSVADSTTLSDWSVDITSTGWVIAIGTLLLLLVALTLVRSTNFALRVNAIAFMVGMFSIGIMVVILLFTSHSEFVSTFNDHVGDPNAYQQVIDNAHEAGVQSFTDGAAIWPIVAIFASMFGWYFWGTYIGGEVRQARRFGTDLKMMFIPLGIMFVGVVILLATLFRTFGYDFITSALYLALTAPDKLPADVAANPILFLTGLLSGSKFIAVLIVVTFLAWIWPTICILLMMPVRAALAWSMDQVVPDGFTRVNPRTHTPVIATATVTFLVFLILIYSTQSDLPIKLYFVSIVMAGTFSWGITGLAALFLHRRKPEIYQQLAVSKYHPLLPISGVFAIAYTAFWIGAYYKYPTEFGMTRGLTLFMLGLFLGALVFFWARRAYKEGQGIPMSQAYAELPPE